jgi:conjugal transfer mating pair stabilization protein TraN
MSLRKVVVWFTLVCFVTTQTASVAGPHEEGVAAGQAANPVARGSVTAPSATGVVPGYTTTPPERSYYRQPNLASQGNARLALCATLPNDPTCQAQRGALAQRTRPDLRSLLTIRPWPPPAISVAARPACSAAWPRTTAAARPR